MQERARRNTPRLQRNNTYLKPHTIPETQTSNTADRNTDMSAWEPGGRQASVIGFASPRNRDEEAPPPRTAELAELARAPISTDAPHTPRSAAPTAATGGPPTSAARTSRTPRSVLKTPRVQAADDGAAGMDEGREGLEAGGGAAADGSGGGDGGGGGAASERGGGRGAPRVRGSIVPNLGGVSVDRAGVMAAGETAGGGIGGGGGTDDDGGQGEGGGPLDWLTRSNAATGKSPIKIFEQLQNESLELQEEVAMSLICLIVGGFYTILGEGALTGLVAGGAHGGAAGAKLRAAPGGHAFPPGHVG